MTSRAPALTVVFLALGLCQLPCASAGAQGTVISTISTPVPPSPDVASFMADPSRLLATYPLGGGDLVSAARNLVATDLKTLSSLLTLTLAATDDQKNAIGTGIGLAALALLQTNPQAASVIQTALVSFNDAILTAAYAAATGNQHLTAAGPGGGGGGSPGSAETSTDPQGTGGGIAGNSFPFPNFATKNVADTFTIPSIPTFTAAPPSDPPTTVAGPVSPSIP
jgi:hypothetical protein